jgi:hypothetical protein
MFLAWSGVPCCCSCSLAEGTDAAGCRMPCRAGVIAVGTLLRRMHPRYAVCILVVKRTNIRVTRAQVASITPLRRRTSRGGTTPRLWSVVVGSQAQTYIRTAVRAVATGGGALRGLQARADRCRAAEPGAPPREEGPAQQRGVAVVTDATGRLL